MITAESLDQYTTETRSLVSSSCVVLFEQLNDDRVNLTALRTTIEHINAHGVTPQVISWYETSHVSNKSLQQTITDKLSGEAADQIKLMINVDHEYWNTYDLTVGTTADKLNNHKLAYDLAKQFNYSTLSGTHYNKTHAALSVAAASCTVDQTKDAFSTFHGRPGETMSSRIESSFDNKQSTHLLDIINNGADTYNCDNTDTCEETIRTDGTGDDKLTETIKPTFATGSARESKPQTTQHKSAEPWYQHLNTNTSLDNAYIASNLIESAASSLDHARFGSIFDQIQTSPDYIHDITHMFMSDTTTSSDKTLDVAQQINKHNDFIQSQLEENLSAIKDADDRVTTEDIQDVSQ
jgi:hypothetical protein